MSKRIAILTPVIPPYVGGIGKAALAEAEMLARDFDVTIFTPKYNYISSSNHREAESRGDLPANERRLPRFARNDDALEEQRGEVKIKYVKPFFAFGNAAILTGLKKELKDFDTIYLHYPFFGTAEGIFFDTWKYQRKLDQRMSMIIRYHMDIVGRGWLRLFFWLHAKLIMPRILKRADKVIVSTFDYARNSNIKNLLKKCPEKFVEIPFGVDTEKFKPASKDQNLLARLNLKPEDKILLFVGGLDRAHYFKGVDTLICAIGKLCFKIQDSSFKLIVVGDGDLRPYYENLAKDLGINDHVRFVGKVSSQDLPKYYNLADVFVFPSIDKSEAFGIALLEAEACGKAVVVSNLPGVRSLVEDGKNGFLVEPKNTASLADKIKLSIERSEEFGKNSRVMVISKFDQSNVGERLLDAFRKL